VGHCSAHGHCTGIGPLGVKHTERTELNEDSMVFEFQLVLEYFALNDSIKGRS
jgi:hypothetical protein